MKKYYQTNTVTIMEITLKNFKTWKKKKVSLPAVGNVLLNGVSGAGKSSVLQAIYFCLYGKGQDLITHGEKTMKVEIEFGKTSESKETKSKETKSKETKSSSYCKITRSKKPNVLSYEDRTGTYDDDAAQEIINQRFGTNFLLTSYMIQKTDESFLKLGPTEKEKFLEKLAFDGVDIAKMKSLLKEKTKDLKDKLIGKTAQLELTDAEFKKIKLPKETTFPVDMKGFIANLPNSEEIKTKKDMIKFFQECKKPMEMELKNSRKSQSEKESLLISIEKRMEKSTLKKQAICIAEESLASKKTEFVAFLKKGRPGSGITRDILENDFIDTPQSGIDQKKIIERIVAEKTSIDKLILDVKELGKKAAIKEKYDMLKEKYNKSLANYKKMEEDEKKKNAMEIEKLERELEELKESKARDQIEELLIKKKKVENMIKISDRIDDKEKIINKKALSLIDEKEVTDLEEKCANYIETVMDISSRIDIQQCPGCKASLRVLKNKICKIEGEPVCEEDKSLLADLTEKLPKIKEKLSRNKSLISELKQLKSEHSLLKKELVDCDAAFATASTANDHDLSTISDINKKLKKIEEAIDRLKTEAFRLKTMQSKLESLKESDSSPTLRTLKKELLADKERLKQMKPESPKKEVSVTTKSIDQLLEEKSELTSLKEHIERYVHETGKIIENIDHLKEELEDITDKMENQESEVEEINDGLLELKDKIQTLESNLSKYEILDEQLNKYLKYKEKLVIYEEWKTKYEKLKMEETEISNKIAVAGKLKTKIAETESVTIDNVIRDINHSVKMYLERFFPDHPISVEIRSFKETKKDIKPQISIFVMYKDVECKLTSLSGGERDRVELAFMLAMNSLYNSNLLMLDECISSLDQDLCFEILDNLKEEKLIIIISHQVSHGVFTKVIDF